MNEELEDYMMKRMFYEKYGKETFEKAKEEYFKRINLKKLSCWKRCWILFDVGSFESKHFVEIKKIQECLIQEILNREEYLP